MEIVILDGYTTNPGDQSWESIEKLGKLTVYDRTDSRNREEVISRIGNADIVITNKVKIDEELFEKCPNIKYIGLLSTGYNIVDIEAARKRNIPVCNVPAYSTEAVTQFTMGLLLEICLHIGEYNAEVLGFCKTDGTLLQGFLRFLIVFFGLTDRAFTNIFEALL